MENNILHKILIVDDIPENIYALENIIEEEGREFIKANSGEEALKLLLKHEIDLILLDVQMPGMDGFETAKLIRGTQRTKHIPIVFVTAISKQEQHIFKGYESGAVDYMFKPLNPNIVKSKVKILLELSEQRRLLKSQNSELRIAKRNAECIFSHVEEGICIIDTDYTIQPQYSIVLEEMLFAKELDDQSILDIFEHHMEEKLFHDAKDYLELMLNNDAAELDLEELNPLHIIPYKQELDINDKRFTKYLDFKIKRILNKDEIAGLLITVTDQTSKIILEKKLKLAEEKSKRNYEVINILKVEPLLVKEFLKQSEREILKIEEIVKNLQKTKDAVEQIDNVYRLMHSIKGNAGLLGLEFIAQKAHHFEQIINDTSHDVDSFISRKSELYVIINQIKEIIHEIYGFINIMKEFYEKYGKEGENKSELLVNAIYGIINQAKNENKSKIKFDYRDFDAKILPVDSFLDVKDILVQLTRNTLAHNYKSEHNSDEILNIKLMNELNDDEITIIYKDDGVGLQYEKIKEKALEQNKFTREQLDTMPHNELAKLIFDSRLSTSNEADLVAGRGMGMCIVQHKIDELGGSIEVDSEEGSYCSFKIHIPKNIHFKN